MKIGELLKSEREKRGLSLHEVGLSLKINPKVLSAIENEETEMLPAKTFLRGFVKSYAQYLKLDVDSLMRLFHDQYGSPQQDIMKPHKNEKEEQSNDYTHHESTAGSSSSNSSSSSVFSNTSNHTPTGAIKNTSPSLFNGQNKSSSNQKQKDLEPLSINDSRPFVNIKTISIATLIFGMIIFVYKMIDKYQKERPNISISNTELAGKGLRNNEEVLNPPSIENDDLNSPSLTPSSLLSPATPSALNKTAEIKSDTVSMTGEGQGGGPSLDKNLNTNQDPNLAATNQQPSNPTASSGNKAVVGVLSGSPIKTPHPLSMQGQKEASLDALSQTPSPSLKSNKVAASPSLKPKLSPNPSSTPAKAKSSPSPTKTPRNTPTPTSNGLPTNEEADSIGAGPSKTNLDSTSDPLIEKTASPSLTATPTPRPKSYEIIVEALDKVTIKYSMGEEPPQSLTLMPDELHTFKSKKSIKLDISDGGSISVIVNGRERGVPGTIGKPIKLSLP